VVFRNKGRPASRRLFPPIDGELGAFKAAGAIG
jgi:hypothetical protein